MQINHKPDYIYTSSNKNIFILIDREEDVKKTLDIILT